MRNSPGALAGPASTGARGATLPGTTLRPETGAVAQHEDVDTHSNLQGRVPNGDGVTPRRALGRPIWGYPHCSVETLHAHIRWRGGFDKRCRDMWLLDGSETKCCPGLRTRALAGERRRPVGTNQRGDERRSKGREVPLRHSQGGSQLLQHRGRCGLVRHLCSCSRYGTGGARG